MRGGHQSDLFLLWGISRHNVTTSAAQRSSARQHAARRRSLSFISPLFLFTHTCRSVWGSRCSLGVCGCVLTGVRERGGRWERPAGARPCPPTTGQNIKPSLSYYSIPGTCGVILSCVSCLVGLGCLFQRCMIVISSLWLTFHPLTSVLPSLTTVVIFPCVAC